MSEVDARFVKRGRWTNLDQGEIMGQTITTDSTTGAIIIALMAVLSTMGTSHLWSVLLFILHQIRANGPGDGLFRQHQALLRTLLSPSSLMAESAKLWWCWRKTNKGAFLRSLTQFLLAAFCMVGFIAASIASSFVVSNSDLEVLVHSPLCGIIGNIPAAETFRAHMSSIKAVSVPYAEECYRNQDLLPARCKAYVHPQIRFSTERASCPFDTKYCEGNVSSAGSAIALDSGLVDLNAGFGFNLPKKDGVSYRRRTTCAILPLGGRTTIINASDYPDSLQALPDIIPEEKFLLMHYGKNPKLDQWGNVTVLHSLLRGNISTGYTVKGAAHFAALDRPDSGNGFVPLKGMRRSDADVNVKFLGSRVKYTQPVEDPWFSAHKPTQSLDVSDGYNITMFLPDNPLTGIGCAVQHQFCIKTAANERCSKLDHLPLDISSENWEEASPLQLSALQLIWMVNHYIHFQAIDSVKAQNFVTNDGMVGDQIPPDQWIREIERMEAVVWASSQVSVADFAVGPSVRNPGLAKHVVGPTSEGDKELCRLLKVRKAGGFVNINVFGMSFVIATALFFAIIDTVLLRFLVYLTGFRQALGPRIESWIQDGVLQLQRRAYEAHNQGTWSELDKEVPLTESNELLKDLPTASLPSVNGSATSTLLNEPQAISTPQPQSTQAPTNVSQPALPHSTPPQSPLPQPTSQPSNSSQLTLPLPTQSHSSSPQSPLSQLDPSQPTLPQPTPAQPTPPQFSPPRPASPLPAQPLVVSGSTINQGANSQGPPPQASSSP